ncbi:hypothetical protein CFK38_05845 [Brachybacterium vulturis]|uniref:Uncharacterized protein n=1 Tax=Brachybacterium vulturis TaxID=2017484 RepID=A0A291GLQ1_9MICO|nr:hypothetical protein [Brachybacterium vulturis]ATG51108.1 hypothetical protein CFK38_05845 [Brachybacterium vulturis]
MIENFLIGLLASTIVSIALWLLLPRGVVITRSKPAKDDFGEPIPDSWVLRNQSPLPVKILRVRYMGFSTIVNETPMWNPLTPSELNDEPFYAVLDSDVGGGEVISANESWRGFQITPGDGLVLRMPNNHTLEVRYRRAGWAGILERRALRIHGFA